MKTLNLTEGSIFQKLIFFSLPMIAGNLLQQVYNLADTLIVGRYIGPDALASVGSAYTLMIFITSIIIGLCMGSGAFFSADHGKKDEAQLKEDIRYSFWFILSVSAVIYLIIFPGMEIILKLLQTPAELMDMTREYVTVVFTGIIFVFLYNFFSYLLRSTGNSVVPLIFLAVSAAINIMLDIWFIAGLKLGVRGAALATVIAQAVSGAGISVYSLIRLPVLRFRKEDLKWNPRRMKEIILNDVATGMQQSIMNFGILLIQGLVNSFGTVIMASFAAAVKIDTIAYMPAQEFGNAYSLFISQNYGAKKESRIRSGTKIALLSSVAFCAAVSVFVFVFADRLMNLFVSSSETQIIAEGAKYLRIEGAMYLGIGILFLWYGYFRGVNLPHISLILTVISLGTRVILSYALAPHTALGASAIWLSIPIGWVLADAAGYLFYQKSKAASIKANNTKRS
ncbi:MAG: MATE family efflux transporter [Firmicutes bacterium]|nr:MATE family efflux transporter [Bacillota bacterium]